jgi:hypothetical protein
MAESFLQKLVASFLHSSATAVSIILCGADRVRVRWIVFCPERYQAAAAVAAHVTHWLYPVAAAAELRARQS